MKTNKAKLISISSILFDFSYLRIHLIINKKK
jgi:hypothetical protein